MKFENENEDYPEGSLEILPIAMRYNFESEYDCSVDNQFRLRLPVKVLVNGMGLQWSGHGNCFSRKDKIVMYDPSVKEVGPGFLLSNSDMLKEYMNSKDYELVWMWFIEKSVIQKKFRYGEYGNKLINGVASDNSGNPIKYEVIKYYPPQKDI